MSSTNNKTSPYTLPHNFKNPLTHLWGFHCHNDIPRDTLPNALVIQRELIDFLLRQGAPIVRDEAYYPGYGPHLDAMWEIRIEMPVHADIGTKKMELRDAGAKETEIDPNDEAFLKSDDGKYDFVRNAKKLLPLAGIATLWMLNNKNQRGLGGYLHFIDHDESLPLKPMMQQETQEHYNILYFSHTKTINMDFFLNPPLEPNGNLVDTRTSRIMSKIDREKTISESTQKDLVFASDFLPKGRSDSPKALFAEKGFRIFVNFSGRSLEQRTLGFQLYETLLLWLEQNSKSSEKKELLPDEKWIEESQSKFDAGFSMTFRVKDEDSMDLCTRIGYTLIFLMMNHGNLEVSMIPIDYPAKAVRSEEEGQEGSNENDSSSKSARTETTVLGLGGSPICFIDRPPKPYQRVIRF